MNKLLMLLLLLVACTSQETREPDYGYGFQVSCEDDCSLLLANVARLRNECAKYGGTFVYSLIEGSKREDFTVKAIVVCE